MNADLFPSRCWAEIDYAALRHNAGVVRARITSGVDILAVVKANGYGHGMSAVAAALAADVQAFGVANLQEAIELRESGALHPILILGPALPEERDEISAQGFIPAVSNFEEARAYSKLVRPVAINFVIDTGMGRMGTWRDEVVAVFSQLVTLPNIAIHSISTHLPSADEDAAFTCDELGRFDALVAEMRQQFPGSYRVHVLLSAGILAFNGKPFQMVRAGLMLYGISPLPEFQELLRPALALKTRVALVRDVPAGRGISYGRTFVTPAPMRIATVSAGYADGYPRHLSNAGAAVLIGGQRCAVLGRVTMDLMMVDVTQLPEVAPGAEVVLIGRQGGEEILASELAARAGTIPWEIFTGIGSRVRRVYS